MHGDLTTALFEFRGASDLPAFALQQQSPSQHRLPVVSFDAGLLQRRHGVMGPLLSFCTTTGQRWVWRAGGDRWDGVFDALPSIHNVTVGVV